LSIYRQPRGLGAGRQQLFADVKCQERDNEVKPLLGALTFRAVPLCRAALLAARNYRVNEITQNAQRHNGQSYRQVTPHNGQLYRQVTPHNRLLGSSGNSARFIEPQRANKRPSLVNTLSQMDTSTFISSHRFYNCYRPLAFHPAGVKNFPANNWLENYEVLSIFPYFSPLKIAPTYSPLFCVKHNPCWIRFPATENYLLHDQTGPRAPSSLLFNEYPGFSPELRSPRRKAGHSTPSGF
jgi:hypothetical protein